MSEAEIESTMSDGRGSEAASAAALVEPKDSPRMHDSTTIDLLRQTYIALKRLQSSYSCICYQRFGSLSSHPADENPLASQALLETRRDMQQCSGKTFLEKAIGRIKRTVYWLGREDHLIPSLAYWQNANVLYLFVAYDALSASIMSKSGIQSTPQSAQVSKTEVSWVQDERVDGGLTATKMSTTDGLTKSFESYSIHHLSRLAHPTHSVITLRRIQQSYIFGSLAYLIPLPRLMASFGPWPSTQHQSHVRSEKAIDRAILARRPFVTTSADDDLWFALALILAHHTYGSQSGVSSSHDPGLLSRQIPSPSCNKHEYLKQARDIYAHIYSTYYIDSKAVAARQKPGRTLPIPPSALLETAGTKKSLPDTSPSRSTSKTSPNIEDTPESTTLAHVKTDAHPLLGGVYWSGKPSHPYVGAVSSLLFSVVAASLYLRQCDSATASIGNNEPPPISNTQCDRDLYLETATQSLAFVYQTLLLDNDLIADGLKTNTGAMNRTPHTCNTGLFIRATSILYQITHDPFYATLCTNSAKAAMHHSPWHSTDGILSDQVGDPAQSPDGIGFKGILLRYLAISMSAIDVSLHDEVRAYIAKQVRAISMVASDSIQDPARYCRSWTTHSDIHTAGSQMVAIDALLAGLQSSQS